MPYLGDKFRLQLSIAAKQYEGRPCPGFRRPSSKDRFGAITCISQLTLRTKLVIRVYALQTIPKDCLLTSRRSACNYLKTLSSPVEVDGIVLSEKSVDVAASSVDFSSVRKGAENTSSAPGLFLVFIELLVTGR